MGCRLRIMVRPLALGLLWCAACAGAPASDGAPSPAQDASAPSMEVLAPARPVAAASHRSTRPTFVDVALAAGIDHVQATTLVEGRCARSRYCEEERMTGGVAVGDVDGDGRDDLLASRMDGPIGIYLNRGDGTFAASALTVPGLRSNGLGLADVDDDADLDLYVTTYGDGLAPNDRHHLFINDGTGTFAEDALARGAAVASARPRAGTSVAFGDYDRDGHLDLYVGEWAALLPGAVSSHARLLRNLGGGVFEDVTVAQGLHTEPCEPGQALCGVDGFAAAFTDLDDDGWLDLAIVGDFGSSRLLWNDGGAFHDGTRAAGVGTDEHGMGSTVGDFDADGDLDWFVTSIHDPERRCGVADCNWGFTGNRLYRNEGGRVFTDATDDAGVRHGSWGWGAAAFDYDNDGDLDLISAAGVDFAGSTVEDLFEDAPTFLWENDGSGRMVEVAALVGIADRRMGKGLAVLDFDDDGDLDVVVANTMDRLALYRNDGGNANGWLRVRVLEASGRPAHGARVLVFSRDRRQLREIGTTTHLLGQSEAVAHCGLGPAPGPVDLEVRFPDGTRRRLEGVEPNRTVIVRR